jgi:hypothetical protein
MADEKRRLGEVDPSSVRRIGHQHAIITPPRESTLLDVADVRRELKKTERGIAQSERQLTMLRGQRDRQIAFLAAFDAQPIDRVDGDPEVSLISPEERTKLEAAADAKLQATEVAERAAAADKARG